jgi:hypothetical protein
MARLADELIDYGDGVVVLFSYMDEDDKGRFSRLLSKARGNHYLRIGMASDYAQNLIGGNVGTDDDDENAQV